jgi:hypothetical protein
LCTIRSWRWIALRTVASSSSRSHGLAMKRKISPLLIASTIVGSASTAVMRMRDAFGCVLRLSTRKSRPSISGMRWSEMITANWRSARMASAFTGLEQATTW